MHRTQVLDRRRGLDAESDLLPQGLLPTIPEDDGESGSPKPDRPPVSRSDAGMERQRWTKDRSGRESKGTIEFITWNAGATTTCPALKPARYVRLHSGGTGPSST